MSSVAAVQVRVDDKETADERVDRVLTMLRETCRPADLVLLPELWPVGAFSLDRVLSWAQPIDGPFAESMATLARDWGAVLHAGSFPERHAGGVSNTSIVFGPDGDLLTSYRKIHLFGFDAGEAAAVSAGSDVAVLQTPLGITGLTTCYDLRFPELYRHLTDAGAHAFLIPAGWPAERIGHWRVLAQARAIENQAVVVAANAVGVSGGVTMGGRSMVIAADGTVLVEADGTHEQILSADIDPDHLAAWRAEFPALRDRRSWLSAPRSGTDPTQG